MASIRTTPETRFDGFDVHTTSYKKIGDHEIQVGILIPKHLKPGKHPLVVKWHGGGLVGGTALYKPWFATFWPPFLLRHNAITILPNYRLIPEHNGFDILSDIFSFWNWYNTSLAPIISSINPAIELDFDHLLVAGESAGGHMGAHSAMMTPKGMIKAMLLQYPMTNYLRRNPVAELYGLPTPGPEIVDEYVSKIVRGTVVSSREPPSHMDLSYALSVSGRYREFFGYTKGLQPIEAIEDATWFPPTYIIHGEQDGAVSVEDSRAFKKRVGEVLGKETGDLVRLEVQDGDHGFDGELMEEDAAWLKEGLKWVEEQWLA